MSSDSRRLGRAVVASAGILLCWSGCGRGPIASDVKSLLFLGDGGILLSLFDGRVIRSEDEGATWVVAGRIPPAGYRSPYFWQLVSGESGTVWGHYGRRGGGGFLHSRPSPVGVSQDGGASFIDVGFNLDTDTAAGLVTLIERPESHPLLLADDGQLWAADALHTTFSQVGVPNPGGEAIDGVFCGGRLFVAGGELLPDGLFVSRIWMSSDLGASWVGQLPLAPFSILSCAPGDVAWAATREGDVFRHDADRESWDEVISLRESGLPRAGPTYLSIVSAAADDGGIYIAGLGALGELFVLRVENDGTASEFEDAPPMTMLEIAGDGAVWGARDGVFRLNGERQTWEQMWPR